MLYQRLNSDCLPADTEAKENFGKTSSWGDPSILSIHCSHLCFRAIVWLIMLFFIIFLDEKIKQCNFLIFSLVKIVLTPLTWTNLEPCKQVWLSHTSYCCFGWHVFCVQEHMCWPQTDFKSCWSECSVRNFWIMCVIWDIFQRNIKKCDMYVVAILTRELHWHLKMVACAHMLYRLCQHIPVTAL